MKRYASLTLSLLLIGLLSACAAPVKTEYDRDTRFDGYQQFAWKAPERESVDDPQRDSALLDRRVATIVSDVLNERGYEQVATENADFLVTYHVVDRQQASSSGSRVSIGVGSGGFGGGVSLGGSRARIERLLLIDIIDANSDQLVWRGWKDSDGRQDRLDDATLQKLTSQILEKFPPSSR
jgi:hypothetical protein